MQGIAAGRGRKIGKPKHNFFPLHHPVIPCSYHSLPENVLAKTVFSSSYHSSTPFFSSCGKEKTRENMPFLLI